MSSTLIPGAPPFQSGVGGGDDLLLSVREDLEGGWYARLRPGHYFLAEQERYLFARKGYYSWHVGTPNVQATLLHGVGLTPDPTAHGPVLLRRGSDGRRLQRVAAPLAAYEEIGPGAWTTVDGDLKRIDMPGILLGLCSDPQRGVYLPAPSVADLLSTEDFYYDVREGRVYITDAAPPHLFRTYVRGSAADYPLEQQEIRIVGTDGKVRVAMTGVLKASGYGPWIWKATPTGKILVEATAVAGNVLTFDNTDIQPGDIVGVAYYAKDTFHVRYQSGSLHLTCLVSQADDYFLEWETGGDQYDTSQLPTSDPNHLQLNPLLAPRESGFLYLTDAAASWPSAAALEILVDDTAPLHDADRAPGVPPLLVTVVAKDSEGDPLPGQLVSLSASGVACQILQAHGETAETNGLGQVLFRVWPLGAGTLTLTAHSASLTASRALPVRERSAYTDPAELRLGKLLAHLEEAPYRGTLRRFNAYHCFADGAPLQPDGADTEYHSSITFTAERSTLHSMDLAQQGPRLTIVADLDGVASVLVDPAPGDVLRAEVSVVAADGTVRKKRARPIRLPSSPSAHGPETGAEES